MSLSNDPSPAASGTAMGRREVPTLENMPNAHPRWNNIDFATQGAELRQALGTGRLQLLHAWGNIIWADEDTAYKLTHSSDRSRYHTTLSVLKYLLTTDPAFPTLAPKSFEAQQVRLPDSGTWLITTWPFMELGKVDHTSAESYHGLGRILARLHAIEVPHLRPHDPLQWASARIDELGRTRDVDALRDRMAELRLQYADTFAAHVHVTAHGDVHWDQVAICEGEMSLLDFENAARAHPSADLIPSAGWIRRTGHPRAHQMRALQEGYGRVWPELTREQERLGQQIAAFSRHTWQLLHGWQGVGLSRRPGS